MKLNDPFGRVGRREQAGYAAVKSQLLAEGVSSISALDASTRRITRSVVIFALVVIGISVLVASTVPAWRGLIGVFAALGLIWIGATFVRTRLHLKRFRDELKKVDSPASASTQKDHPPEGGKS